MSTADDRAAAVTVARRWLEDYAHLRTDGLELWALCGRAAVVLELLLRDVAHEDVAALVQAIDDRWARNSTRRLHLVEKTPA
jgi:hypothetical protein